LRVKSFFFREFVTPQPVWRGEQSGGPERRGRTRLTAYLTGRPERQAGGLPGLPGRPGQGGSANCPEFNQGVLKVEDVTLTRRRGGAEVRGGRDWLGGLDIRFKNAPHDPLRLEWDAAAGFQTRDLPSGAFLGIMPVEPGTTHRTASVGHTSKIGSVWPDMSPRFLGWRFSKKAGLPGRAER
jgi:hypothetical protein